MIGYGEIRAKSETVCEYLEKAKSETVKFQERYDSYDLDRSILEKLKGYSKDVIVYAFSAEWCPDCYKQVPVMALISERTGIEVRIFGHLMRDSKSDTRLWACPPSPEEVNYFHIKKIPTFIILDRKGKELGRIVESPPEGKTLEDSLLNIISNQN
jgi:thiol-disulfide isomerase/thioredoxin